MKIININGVAVASSDRLILTDVQSALDLMGDASFCTGSDKIVLFKENIAEEFFDLSTRLMGEVLQKFVTYRIRIAIVGDFSMYKSKALKDFIYESNQGKHVYFATDQQSAIEKLAK